MKIGRTSFTSGALVELNPDHSAKFFSFTVDSVACWVVLRWRGSWYQAYRPRSFRPWFAAW